MAAVARVSTCLRGTALALALVTALSLAGCRTEGDRSSEHESGSSTSKSSDDSRSPGMTVAGSGTPGLIGVIRGNPDAYAYLSTGTDSAITTVAGLVCAGARDHMSYPELVTIVWEGLGDIPKAEAGLFVVDAVDTMCPQYSGQIRRRERSPAAQGTAHRSGNELVALRASSLCFARFATPVGYRTGR